MSTSTFLTQPALYPLIDLLMRIDNYKSILTFPAHAQQTSWDDQNKSVIEFSWKLLHEHRNVKGYLTAGLCGC